jgi:hypothetical protein
MLAWVPFDVTQVGREHGGRVMDERIGAETCVDAPKPPRYCGLAAAST